MKFCANIDNIRIDKFLSEITNYSRSNIARNINQGLILVNKKKVKPGYLIKKRDEIIFKQKTPEKLFLQPQPLNIEIVYQDDFIAVVNKPAGMVVHPSPGHNDNTLVNAILYYCKDLSGINDVLRPGIVHRLDKDTSGLMVIAKNDQSHLNLAEQFKNREVKKYYKALVWGHVKPETGEIETFIGRHKKNRLKFSSFTNKGKIAITNYQVEKYIKSFTLLNINIKTGRTHQIRVHFSEKGYPLVGDNLYGEKKNKKIFLDRIFLHSYKLEFTHPNSKKRVEFKIDLPDELKKFLLKIIHCRKT